MSDASQDRPLSPGGYDVDLVCAFCGYNLRGLNLNDNCPECGHSTAASLESWKLRLLNRAQPMSDPHWVSTLAEGAALSLVGFVLIVILAASPPWMYRWRTTQRSLALGVACAAWVICWYGLWKLTRPDPNHQETQHGRLFRIVCRLNGTLLAATPLLMFFLSGLGSLLDNSIAEALIMLIGLLVALTTGAAYYLHTLSICQRLRSRGLSAYAIGLSVANLVVFITPLLPEFDGPESSLERLMEAPTCAFGAPAVMRGVFDRWLWYWGLNGFSIFDTLMIAAAVIFLAAGLFHALLYTALRRMERKLRAAPATAPPTQPNSPT